MTRHLTVKALLLTTAALATTPAWSQSQTTPADNARAVHDRALVFDDHVDVLLPATPGRYAGTDGQSQASLAKLRTGGVDGVVFSIAVGPGAETPEGLAEARHEADQKVSAVKSFVADSGGQVEQAYSADDIERIHRDGHIAVLLGFQNFRSLGDDLSAFDGFYASGVRIAALNHAGHNAFSDSSRPIDEPEARHNGLSPLGRQAIAHLNDLGVLIDVSQASSPALIQTLALTRAPVVASHSDVRALVDQTRNLSDAELDAIKANGGVVLLTPFSGYIVRPTAEDIARTEALRVEFGLPGPFRYPTDDTGSLTPERLSAYYDGLVRGARKGTLSEYVDHVDYVVRRIGADHVGFGSDFNHGAGITGLADESETPNLTAELIRRGYTEAQIQAFWSGNFLRVLRAAEAARKH
jgi:membrane dipeptidase